ncbi:hypothetical protein NRI_0510 [Neorickettsia risticii str. Illinois]|uniref:Uncharacterized protein n=1 Tax=Neorickettsia risticii (strain Illinois) TaxID=434131 RepID=C6V524_NEORI|nr:hypothetical protein NRI_0510 [Neorickettsia risticii str. Illinois]
MFWGNFDYLLVSFYISVLARALRLYFLSEAACMRYLEDSNCLWCFPVKDEEVVG